MASAKVIEQKQAAVKDLADKMRNGAAGVLVKYEGITVENDTKLRKDLREAGVYYTVMKNTLTGRACDEAGFGEMKQFLTGMTAIAISESDPLAPAKILSKFAEGNEKFEIKSGFIDGAVIDVAKISELAKTPSKEVLIGKMLGSLQSSLYGLCYVLQAKIDKDGGADEAKEA